MAALQLGAMRCCLRFVLVLLLWTIYDTKAARGPIDVAISVNTKRIVHRTGELFLGLQIDPAELLVTQDPRWGSSRSLALARGLAPAYLRVAGPGTDALRLAVSGAGDPHNVTEADWLLLSRFCAAAGLRPAVGLSAAARQAGAWDPRPALPLLGLAASLGCDLTWQLGFEPQEARPAEDAGAETEGREAGAQLGRDVVALRRLLDAFPQCAARARVLAPDATRVRGHADAAFLRAALDLAAPHLAALSWHPSLLEAPEGPAGRARPRPSDQLLLERDALLRLLPRIAHARAPAPLWIGEPAWEAVGPAAEAVEPWEAALRWARRLGLAARLGAAVALRWVRPQSLLDPSPDYWVSLLHRRLVGDGVFDSRAVGGRRLDVFCRCALQPPGALLLMAVNGARARARLTVKGLPTAASGAPLLQYVLTHRDGQTLLNGRPLELGEGETLPPLGARALPPPPPASVSPGSHALTLAAPPRSVVFWVLPGAGVRACAAPAPAPALAADSAEEVSGDFEDYWTPDLKEEPTAAAKRRRKGGLRDAARRRQPPPQPKGVAYDDGEAADGDYDDYYDDAPDPARPGHPSPRNPVAGGSSSKVLRDARDYYAAAGGPSSAPDDNSIGGDGGGGALEGGDSAEAVWSIAQASLLADRRATVGVDGAASDADESLGDADPDDALPADPPPELSPREREKYLKSMFVNMITKGPEAVERARARRHAGPGMFVMAAQGPERPGGARRPKMKKEPAEKWEWGRERERERGRGRGRTPLRRGAKDRDGDREAMDSPFGPVEGGLSSGEDSFPRGDVYLHEGNSQSAQRNEDYDYVQDGEPERPRAGGRRRERGGWRRGGDDDEDDDGLSPEHFGHDNHITEYQHSELFERLGVERAPATPPGPACEHELAEAASLRALPPPLKPGDCGATNATDASDASDASEDADAAPVPRDSAAASLPDKEAGRHLASYMERTRTARRSDELEDYRESEEAAEKEGESNSSQDFDEALLERAEARRGSRALSSFGDASREEEEEEEQERVGGDGGSCEARRWSAEERSVCDA